MNTKNTEQYSKLVIFSKKILILFFISLISHSELFSQCDWEDNSFFPGKRIYDIEFVSPTKGWLTGSDGLIAKTTDAGQTWTELTSGTTEWFNAIDVIDEDTIYVAGNNNQIRKSTDGGNTWTQLTSPNYLHHFGDIYFPTKNSGFLCGYTYNGPETSIWKTDDNGQTWNSVFDMPTTLIPQKFQFISDDIGYFWANDNSTWPAGVALYKTVSGGNSWSLIYDSPIAFNSLFFENENTGYAAEGYGGTNQILKTIDGGLNWIGYPSGSTQPKNDIYFDGNDGFAVGGEFNQSGQVLVSADGGLSWTEDTIISSNSLACLEFISDNLIFVGTHGGATVSKSCYSSIPLCPENISPITGSTLTSIDTLSWKNANDSEGYNLTIGDCSGCTNILNTDVGNVDFYELSNLPVSTTVYINLVSYNNNGNSSGCTELIYTTFTPVACTSLTNPVNGATDVSVDADIIWSSVTGADGYFIIAGYSQMNHDIIDSVDVGNVLTYDLGTMQYESEVFVKIIPYDASGNAIGCNYESFVTEVCLNLPDLIIDSIYYNYTGPGNGDTLHIMSYELRNDGEVVANLTDLKWSSFASIDDIFDASDQLVGVSDVVNPNGGLPPNGVVTQNGAYLADYYTYPHLFAVIDTLNDLNECNEYNNGIHFHFIPGCTTQYAHNYNPNANVDDGSCMTCFDGIQNGDETGIDCGGAHCYSCDGDSLALIAIYNSLNGPNWTNTWDLGATMDTWYGVELLPNSPHLVGELNLSNNNLTGTIPDEFGDFHQIFNIDLSDNQISGSIPSSIGNLAFGYGPQRIYLNDNLLIGSIPSGIGDLLQIIELDLSHNNLSGSIPTEIGNLFQNEGISYVKKLDLSQNQLTGNIPEEIGDMLYINSLYLGNNLLTGTIPTSIGNLIHCGSLELQNNQLTGTIPSSIGNLEGLYRIRLNNNQLSGSIPASLGSLFNIFHSNSYLDLSNNELTGSIPIELGQMTFLHKLYLNDNHLSGTLPSTIGNLSNIEKLYLHFNQLSGSIPPEIGNLFQDDVVQPQYLSLNNNLLTGNIPEEIGDMLYINGLYLGNNLLTGSIPTSIGNLIHCGSLELQNNQLTGTIPSSIGNMTNLQALNLGANLLSGNIPVEIWNMTQLTSLLLYSNQLTGSLPQEIGNLTNLFYLNLGGNQLSGEIPPEIGNLVNIGRGLLLSNNQFTGSIPSELGNLFHEDDSIFSPILTLSFNQLSGNLPPELGDMTYLSFLYLQNNQFTGPIPNELGLLSNLTVLLASDNNLTGCFPSGLSQFCDITMDFNNNPGLPFEGNTDTFCLNGNGECEIGSCSVFSDVPASGIIFEAVSCLCNKGYITPQNHGPNNTNGVQPNSDILRADLAKLLYFAIYKGDEGSPAEQIPVPFIDLQISGDPYFKYAKALSYLEYGDHISPFSRDFINFRPFEPIQLKYAAKVIVEAYNFVKDQSDNGQILNINYGEDGYTYLRTLQINGFLINIISTDANDYADRKDVFIILKNILDDCGSACDEDCRNPNPQPEDYFIPGNFTPSNLSRNVGFGEGFFRNYTITSFNIPGINFPLEFTHMYSSQYPQLPKAYRRIEPLGTGWSHSYNAYIFKENGWTEGGSTIDDNWIVHWPNGTYHFYDCQTEATLSDGVYDIFTTIGDTSITIKKQSQIEYTFEKFTLPSGEEIFLLDEIQDRNNNTIDIVNELAVIPRIDKVIGTAGRVLDFNYSGPGYNELVSIHDVAGNRDVFFNVDSDHNLTSYTDPNGHITTYEYEDSIAVPNSDPLDHLLYTINRPEGNSVKNTYGNGFVTSSQVGTNTPTTSSVQPNYDNPTENYQNTITDGEGTVIDKEYDVNGYQKTKKIGSNQIDYNHSVASDPSLISSVNYQGLQTFYSYDTLGRLTTINMPLGINHTFTYTSLNDIKTYQDPLNHITTYDYDTNGNIDKVTDNMGFITDYTINTQGLLTQIETPENIIQDFTYDAFGNLTQVDAPLNLQTKMTYDAIGRIDSVINPQQQVTKYEFDDLGLVTKKIRRTQSYGDIITQYAYDMNNNLSAVTNALGGITSMTYTDRDQLETSTFGSDTKSYAYYDDGLLDTYTKPGGYVFDYQYDELGRLESDGYSSYEYDNQDNIIKATKLSSSHEINMSYDAINRLDTVMYGIHEIVYEHDKNGNVTKMKYPGGIDVSYVYDANNRLDNLSFNGKTIHYTYKKDGRLENVTLPNGTHREFDYDAAGRMIYQAELLSTNDTICRYFYTLDSLGNHKQELRKEPLGNPPLASLFRYRTYNGENEESTSGFTYDADGNRTSSPGQSVVTTWDEKDLMLTHEGKSYQYDAMGLRYELNDGTNTTKYVWDVRGMGYILAETDASDNITYYYIYGLGLEARVNASTMEVSYYHSDYRGSTIAITDENQVLTHKYSYLPFGRIIMQQEDEPQPFKYVGKYGVMADSDSLYYMRARYMDAMAGRFISEDPVWADNLYPYAGNNPVMSADPDGNLIVAVIVIGATIYGVYQFTKSVPDTKEMINNQTPYAELNNEEEILAEAEKFKEDYNSASKSAFDVAKNAPMTSFTGPPPTSLTKADAAVSIINLVSSSSSNSSKEDQDKNVVIENNTNRNSANFIRTNASKAALISTIEKYHKWKKTKLKEGTSGEGESGGAGASGNF